MNGYKGTITVEFPDWTSPKSKRQIVRTIFQAVDYSQLDLEKLISQFLANVPPELKPYIYVTITSRRRRNAASFEGFFTSSPQSEEPLEARPKAAPVAIPASTFGFNSKT